MWKNIEVFSVDEQPIIHSKTTVFYVCLRITDCSPSPGGRQLSCCWIVVAWKWMEASFFWSIFNWCHSLHFLKYKWALCLEILRVKGSPINGGDILWLTGRFWSWRGVMDHPFIPLVSKLPLWNQFTFTGWSISISQLRLWWPLWGQDQCLLWLMCLNFGKITKQSFMETYCSFSV